MVPAPVLAIGYLALVSLIGYSAYNGNIRGRVFRSVGIVDDVDSMNGMDSMSVSSANSASGSTVSANTNWCAEPSVGGLTCEEDDECNYAATVTTLDDESGNRCEIANNTQTGECVCSLEYAGSNCFHKRYTKDAPGALNIALPFIGFGGIGSFVIGRIGTGIGQLLLTLCFFVGGCLRRVMKRAIKADNAKSTGLVVLRSENDETATEAIGFGCAMACSCIWTLMGLAGLIWSVVFGILILVGDVPDGSGYYPIDASCVPASAGA